MVADLGIQVGPVSGTLQARYVPPSDAKFSTGYQESVALLTGGLVLCGHVKWVFACGVGEAGAIQVLSPLGSNALAQGALGPRLGLAVPFATPGLALRISVEYLKTLRRNHAIYIPGSLDLPTVNAGGGVGLEYTLPLRK
jgi:hypothetical protein